MSTTPPVPTDPLAAAVHLRIEQRRHEADAYRAVRDARTARRSRAAVPARRARSAWPATVAAALRDSLGGRSASPSSTDRATADHGPTACCA